MRAKPLKWKPAISFMCLICSVVFLTTVLYGRTKGAMILGGITGSLAFVSSVLPEHFNFFKSYWFDRILNTTHSVLIWISATIFCIALFSLIQNYRFQFKLIKK